MSNPEVNTRGKKRPLAELLYTPSDTPRVPGIGPPKQCWLRQELRQEHFCFLWDLMTPVTKSASKCAEWLSYMKIV